MSYDAYVRGAYKPVTAGKSASEVFDYLLVGWSRSTSGCPEIGTQRWRPPSSSLSSSRIARVLGAAFDGELLVLADELTMSTLDLNFDLVVSAPLVEGCLSAVLLSDNRFICGPRRQLHSAFHTYDAEGGALLGTSEPGLADGEPMRRVPGRNDFLTAARTSSWSRFYLHELREDVVTLVDESPDEGEDLARVAFAFWGDPPTHVINDRGLILRIRSEGCVPGPDNGCFAREGELGTLPAGQDSYADIRAAGADRLYAIRPDDPDVDVESQDPVCGAPSCTVERIEVSTRTVSASTSFFSERGRVRLRPDPVRGGVFVIATDRGPFLRPIGTDDRYQVHHLAF